MSRTAGITSAKKRAKDIVASPSAMAAGVLSRAQPTSSSEQPYPWWVGVEGGDAVGDVEPFECPGFGADLIGGVEITLTKQADRTDSNIHTVETLADAFDRV